MSMTSPGSKVKAGRVVTSVTIKVTKEHIDKAFRLRAQGKDVYLPSRSCPVSLAAQDALGTNDVKAGVTVLLCFNASVPKRIKLPNDVTQRIYRFDTYGQMAPFEFEAVFA